MFFFAQGNKKENILMVLRGWIYLGKENASEGQFYAQLWFFYHYLSICYFKMCHLLVSGTTFLAGEDFPH